MYGSIRYYCLFVVLAYNFSIIYPRLIIFFILFFIPDLRTAFDLLDRNRDGRVTANELQFMLKNLGINVSDELIHDLIREASHSGKCHSKDLFMWPGLPQPPGQQPVDTKCNSLSPWKCLFVCPLIIHDARWHLKGRRETLIKPTEACRLVLPAFNQV